MWLQGLYLRTLFLGSKCWMLPRLIHPIGNLVHKGNSYDRWRCYPGRSSLIPIRRALSPRYSWTFSFIIPYLSELMFVDNSLDCVVSQRPRCGILVRLPWTVSLMFPYSRRVMIVLGRSLYGVVSHGLVLGLFIPLPPAVWKEFPREQTFRCKRVLAEFCFSVLCSSCFAHSIKAPWFLFPLP